MRVYRWSLIIQPHKKGCKVGHSRRSCYFNEASIWRAAAAASHYRKYLFKLFARRARHDWWPSEILLRRKKRRVVGWGVQKRESIINRKCKTSLRTPPRWSMHPPVEAYQPPSPFSGFGVCLKGGSFAKVGYFIWKRRNTRFTRSKGGRRNLYYGSDSSYFSIYIP